jgi:6-phosphogluconolactonase
MAIDAAGKFAYVANSGSNSNDVSGYAINAKNGALTPVKGSPFAAGYGPIGVAIR